MLKASYPYISEGNSLTNMQADVKLPLDLKVQPKFLADRRARRTSLASLSASIWGSLSQQRLGRRVGGPRDALRQMIGKARSIRSNTEAAEK